MSALYDTGTQLVFYNLLHYYFTVTSRCNWPSLLASTKRCSVGESRVIAYLHCHLVASMVMRVVVERQIAELLYSLIHSLFKITCSCHITSESRSN